MKAAIGAIVALVLAGSVTALPPLERNLAYRSPSVLIGNGLAHDIGHIGATIKKRAYHDYVANKVEGKAKRNSWKTEADFLVDKYDDSVGQYGEQAYKGKISFKYGVAAGDPTTDSAILWTHPYADGNATELPICLRYQTSKAENDWSSTNLVDDSYAWTTADVGYSFKVETTGLSPNTRYWYRFFQCHDHSVVSPTGTFLSLPEPDDDEYDSLKVGVFSCSNYPFGYFQAYAAAAARNNVDYFVHLGDIIYEYRGDGKTVEGQETYGDGTAINRLPDPEWEIVTLDDYRRRYATYRADKDMIALMQRTTSLTIWDDHEVADNTDKFGSADSNNTESGTVRGVRFTDRKLNAVKAYFEWFPIRPGFGSEELRIWRSFRFGNLVDLHLLDTRQFDRSATDKYYDSDEIAALANDTDRSLMGGKQERWLYRNLIESQKRGATWKVIGQQIITNWLNYGQPDFMYNADSWQGYLANRRRLFNTITDNNVENTIILSGDSHANWVYDTVPDALLNGTQYDPATGEGAIGVEFAGTAVSSPPSYGRGLTLDQYTKAAQQLVSINRNLQWAEGDYRGYFELEFTKQQLNANFYGYRNISLPQSDEILLAQFNVKAGANRLSRPINYGITPASGALQAQTVDYSKQSWNGTAFV
ncbi:hypothetical protein BCV70DRAFT_164509 [Testicularia cyperi]|uniref:Alkaline phosphatase n=1 Tax=Testicularia cyperi TaxID=1882483 RepID=A0A317XKT8_9BASI|nr:hypothetical protein BCV70DRAFT_164509 [Testicularia cyperi]